jgi:hypothetical protein
MISSAEDAMIKLYSATGFLVGTFAVPDGLRPEVVTYRNKTYVLRTSGEYSEASCRSLTDVDLRGRPMAGVDPDLHFI